MADIRRWMERLIFGGEASRRFTQDSPVLPDVWIRYGAHALEGRPGDETRDAGRVDLLLTPHRAASAAALMVALRDRLKLYGGRRPARGEGGRQLAYNQATVVARLNLHELVRCVLPLSAWWRDTTQPEGVEEKTGEGARRAPGRDDLLGLLASDRPRLVEALEQVSLGHEGKRTAASPAGASRAVVPARWHSFVWLARVVGSIVLAARLPRAKRKKAALDAVPTRYAEVVDAFAAVVQALGPAPAEPPGAWLWSVSLNREVHSAVARSVLAVKADAARRLFKVSCAGLGWAIVDSGIDATHPAFRVRDGQEAREGRPTPPSRVVETYDFTNIRALLDPERAARGREQQALKRRLARGRPLDWDELLPLVRVEPGTPQAVPHNDHGTHVAGVMAADWQPEDDPPPPRSEGPIEGVCPDLRLFDLRVLDANGKGSEFAVMAALQFVRYLNAQHDRPRIHGVNLSLSMPHDVANFACGRTPVCDECDRLVGSGVVVVAAAGNEGYSKFLTPAGDAEGYRSISISDPGNAESVITVGATHRFLPHTYGVSYFSSRGPTGDGRIKPDLVAPGEKITAPIPNGGLGIKDGTSMAAPHVSGAAALLMARHGELLGQPHRVKEILCATATDLRRERYFQGAGMVDVLRALQSV